MRWDGHKDKVVTKYWRLFADYFGDFHKKMKYDGQGYLNRELNLVSCTHFLYEHFYENIEAQIGEILRKPSLGRNLQILMKKVYSSWSVVNETTTGIFQNIYSFIYLALKIQNWPPKNPNFVKWSIIKNR